MITRAMVMVSIWLLQDVAWALDLEEILRLSRRHSPEVAQHDAEMRQSHFLQNAIDGAFDSTLFAEGGWSQDKSERVGSLPIEEQTRQRFQLGVRKFFSTGTQVETSLGRQKTDNRYGSSNLSETSSSATSYNPTFLTQWNLNLSQELWKNRGAKELELQKALQKASEIQPRAAKAIALQTNQYQAERLYWQWLAQKHRLDFQKKLLAKTEAFAEQMHRRVELGRADRVDEASAEINILSQDSSLIELENQFRKINAQLAILIGPPDASTLAETIEVDGSLQSSLSTLPAPSPSDAMGLVRNQRAEFKSLVEKKEQASTRKELSQEGGKPSLALTAGATYSGLDPSSGQSISKTQKRKYPLYEIGLRFSMPLGGTRSAEEILAAHEEIQGVIDQERVLMRSIRRELELAFTELKASQDQQDRAERKIKTFERKAEAETLKLRQARSEKITVLRYEMEILTAKLEHVSALLRRREAESSIRFLTHAYPSE